MFNNAFKKLLLLLAAYSIVAVGIILLFVLSTVMSRADAFELQEISLEYKRFADGSYDPLINTNGLRDRTLDTELNLRLNVDMLDGILFFDNLVHSQTDRVASTGDRGQYRLIGWNYKFGVRITPSFHIQLDHYSRHLLDTQYIYGTYPKEDSIGFIFYVYGGPKGKGLLP